MKKKTLAFGKGFKVIIGNRRVQAAQMVIALEPYTLLLIEHGEHHEIRNNGRTVLKTLNFYSPPGYRKDGTELPAANPSSS